MYKISKGQMVSIWIFGPIGFLVFIESPIGIIPVFIAFILCFYTIGWLDNKENKDKK